MKIVIFHSYVSLPEGRLHQIPLRKWQMFGQHLRSACFWKICPSLPIRGQVYSHLTTDPRVMDAPSRTLPKAYYYITRSHGHMGLNLKCKMFGGCYTPINPKDFEITKVLRFFIFFFMTSMSIFSSSPGLHGGQCGHVPTSCPPRPSTSSWCGARWNPVVTSCS